MNCRHPRFVQTAGGIVTCGRCLHCRINKKRTRSTRIVLEAKEHEDILFCTLTYANEFLPTEVIDCNTGEVFSHNGGVLDRTAVTNFIKRLRRRLPSGTLKYFVCGEYGDRTQRPHYHFVFFGLAFEDRRYIYEAWRNPRTGELMCDPDRLDVQIPRSHWDVGQYVASYLVKSLTRPDHYVNTVLQGRSPEFASWSKGLGLKSVQKLADALKSASGHAFIKTTRDIPRVLNINDKKVPLDRYMKEKLLNALQISEEVKEVSRAKYAQEMQDLLLRASKNPQIPSSWIEDKKRYKWAMEKQFVFEREHSMLEKEHRHELFLNTKGTI